MSVDFSNLIFSKNNIDLYHYKHNDQIIDISKYKNRIIIIGIVTGIFTFGIGGYLIARLLATHYKWKKINNFESNYPTVDKVSNQFKNLPIAPLNSLSPIKAPKPIASNPRLEVEQISLEKTSGFPNAGCTCYIAATLQCLRNSSTFWKFLDEEHKLQKTENETDLNFTLRNNIRIATRNIMEKSNKGDSITHDEMSNFRKLLNSFNPKIPLEGFGDRLLVCDALFTALEIPLIKYRHVNPQNKIITDYFEKHLNLGLNGPEKNLVVQHRLDKALKDCEASSLTIMSLPPLLGIMINNPEDEYFLEPSLEIEIRAIEEKDPVKYRLISMIQTPPNHYIAYLCDLNAEPPSWVCFNDDRVKASSTIENNVKNQIRHLFYERVNE